MAGNPVNLAIEIVNATQWSGDMRVNMNTALSAGRILAKEIERLRDALRVYASRANWDTGYLDPQDGENVFLSLKYRHGWELAEKVLNDATQ